MTTFVFLKETDLQDALFFQFDRRQTVKKRLQKIDGTWQEQEVHFVDNWTADDKKTVLLTLRSIIAQGGMVVGAFSDKKLKGFAAVKAGLFGPDQEYLDLPYIHVSADMRGRGIGKVLFQLAKDWAKAHGAKKLYISAHSSVESQAFYKAMGCVDAKHYSQEHVKREPYDCQLECRL